MKANELRIGNYVNFPEHYPNINDVTQLDEYIMFHESFNPEKCRPIPLTEEWLVKFGFKRGFQCYKKGLLEAIYIHEFNIYVFYIGLDSENEYKIKHVNQLQNIYFALTGEELTIK